MNHSRKARIIGLEIASPTPPNAELFDFHANWETISNLELYRDLQDYYLDVLDDMFVQISNGSGRVDRETLLMMRNRERRQF